VRRETGEEDGPLDSEPVKGDLSGDASGGGDHSKVATLSVATLVELEYDARSKAVAGERGVMGECCVRALAKVVLRPTVTLALEGMAAMACCQLIPAALPSATVAVAELLRTRSCGKLPASLSSVSGTELQLQPEPIFGSSGDVNRSVDNSNSTSHEPACQ
jgi:hypothetical protein